MYKDLNTYYRERFGDKVYKLSLDGNMSCPNRDGKVSVGGCIFCSNKGSGEFSASKTKDIKAQLEEAKARVEKKCKSGKYIPYFQAFTGTYAPIDYLEKIYYEAIEPDFTVALSIATRPDCLPEEVIELLKRINQIKPVFVELGLQSVHEETAKYINRGYKTEVYFDAVERLKAAGIEVVTHIILGLPFESEEMMLETVRQVAEVSHGIKFHMLYVVKGTRLEEEYNKGNVPKMSLEEYAELLKKCIDILPEETVVHRLTGDGAREGLIYPLWSLNKKKVLNYLKKVLKKVSKLIFETFSF